MERVCEKLLAVRDGGGAVDDNAVSIAMMGATVWPRARPGWLHTRGVSYRKSVLHGAFVWACGALNRPKRRIWARADRVPQAEHGGGGGRVLPHLEPLLRGRHSARAGIPGCLDPARRAARVRHHPHAVRDARLRLRPPPHRALPVLSRPREGVYAPFAFPIVNWFCMALLYRRTGRLAAKNGGFRPG